MQLLRASVGMPGEAARDTYRRAWQLEREVGSIEVVFEAVKARTSEDADVLTREPRANEKDL